MEQSKTYSKEQLSLLQQVEMSEEKAWTLGANQTAITVDGGGFHSAGTKELPAVDEVTAPPPVAWLLQSSIHMCISKRKNTFCMPTSCLTTGQFLQPIPCLRSQTTWRVWLFELAPGATQGQRLKSFWYVVFLFQKPKELQLQVLCLT